MNLILTLHQRTTGRDIATGNEDVVGQALLGEVVAPPDARMSHLIIFLGPWYR